MNKSSHIIIDNEMIKNIATIGAKCKEVFSCEMTAQNHDILLNTIIDVHFTHSDNVVELVNTLDTTLDVLNLYAERLKGAGLL